MHKAYSLMIISLLAAASPAVAADEAQVQGSVEIGGRVVDVNSADGAKFEEFRDLDNAAFGRLLLDADKDGYFLQLDAINPGLRDQFYQLKGGAYDIFSVKLNYNEMPHNYGFNDKSFFSGLGTNNLSVSAVPADPATWHIFDYTVKHKDYGGEAKVSFHSPFYLTAGVERHDQKGSRPYGSLNPATFVSPVEFPEPVDYTTDDFFLKAGYQGKKVTVGLTGFTSSFDNANKFLTWQDPNLTLQTDALAPENDYRKLAADLSWRGLPLGSVLALGGSYARLENDFSMADINFDLPAGTVFNRSNFDGEINYKAGSAALSSNPLPALDSKIYYGFLNKDNKSSIISSTGAVEDSNEGTRFSYQKRDAGLDLGYRLPYRTRAEAGYEYLKVKRDIWVLDDNGLPLATTDNIVYLQLSNKYSDYLNAKLRYKRLERGADNQDGFDPIEGVSRFPWVDKDMDEIKLSLESYPLDRLDLGLDFAYRKNDYDDTILGRKDDKRWEIYGDIVWRVVKSVTLSGFAGYEKVKADDSRKDGNPFNFDPVTFAPILDPYRQEIDDDFWTCGLAAKIGIIPEKLRMSLSWQYQKSDGEVDFSQTTLNLVNILNSDDYTKKQIDARLIYTVIPKLDVTLGYLYEKFDYDDINYANYQNVAVSGGFYSGLYAFQDYEANVGYLTLKYGF